MNFNDLVGVYEAAPNNSGKQPYVTSRGSKHWYNNDGQYHRLDGPAIEWSDGSKSWCVNGKLHRLDGPAFEHVNGTKEWWVNGKRHRLDGPAIEALSGHKQWWVNGKKYSEEEFNRLFGKYKNTEDRQVVADMEGLF